MKDRRSGTREAGWSVASVALSFALLAVVLAPACAQAANPGDLDRSFGEAGLVPAELDTSDSGARAVAIDPHHRILAAGFGYDGSSTDFALARFRPNGILDPEFGAGGKVTSDLGGWERIASAAIHSRGRIVVGAANASAKLVRIIGYSGRA